MTERESLGRASSRGRLDVVLITAIVLATALYGAGHLRRGWVPHDEGMLGQAAERVLGGELPHRDFDDLYTGGLSYLNAAAFRLFGVSLVSPRIVLLLVYLAILPVM